MTQGILIALCILAGIMLRQGKILPRGAHKSVNAWIIYVAMPSFALKYVPGIEWNISLITPFLMPFILFLGAWGLTEWLARRYKMSKTSKTALLLAAGWGNTSFVGYPLTEAFYGEAGLKMAILCDQMTFILLTTVGIAFAILATENVAKSSIFHTVTRRMFRFPPFLGFLAALILPHFLDLSPLFPVLDRLSSTLVPLALFSVGLQLETSGWKNDKHLLMWGLSYKLLIAPALVLGIAILTRQSGLSVQVSVFEAAMAPMVTSAILADEYKLDSKLCSLMIGMGLPVSFITTLLWWLIFSPFS
jgi:predicted permease